MIHDEHTPMKMKIQWHKIANFKQQLNFNGKGQNISLRSQFFKQLWLFKELEDVNIVAFHLLKILCQYIMM